MFYSRHTFLCDHMSRDGGAGAGEGGGASGSLRK